MNWKNAFFVALVALAGTLTWALKLNSTKTAQDGTQPEKGHITDDQKHTNVPCSGTYVTVSNTDAACRINTYAAYLSSMTSQYQDYDISTTITSCTNQQSLTLPASNQNLTWLRITQPCELAAMLNNASAADTLNMYIVLGIEADPNNPGNAYIDALFQAPRPGSSGSQLIYYDFTTPCPPMCGSGGNQH